MLPPPVDVKHDYPDLISDSISGPAPMLYNAEPDELATAETHESQETLFELPTVAADYKLPDRSLLQQLEAGRRPERRGDRSALPRHSSRASRTSESRRRSSG